MKTAFKVLAASLVVGSFIFIGCKKAEAGPKGDTGAQGPAGPVINMSSGGFITGTISGTRKDGVTFSEPFNYTYYFPGLGASGTLDSLGGGFYSWDFQRQEADLFSNNYANFYITTSSKTATTGTLSLNFRFEKTLSSSKYFSFYGYPNSLTATGLSYNSTTGAFSGAFNAVISGTNNSTTNSATLTGNFQANIVQMVERKNKDGAIKAD